jgi:hypothetical protein
MASKTIKGMIKAETFSVVLVVWRLALIIRHCSATNRGENDGQRL